MPEESLIRTLLLAAGGMVFRFHAHWSQAAASDPASGVHGDDTQVIVVERCVETAGQDASSSSDAPVQSTLTVSVEGVAPQE